MAIGRRTRLLQTGILLGGILALWPSPVEGQGVELRREVPPPQPWECAPSTVDRRVAPDDAREAARLRTEATHAAILGDQPAARELLARAAALDPTADDIAFLFARTLEELGEEERAIREYCRFVGLTEDAAEARNVREHVRRTAPYVRAGIPDSAVARFQTALAAYDDARLTEAEADLSVVVDAAPLWASPYYNRGIVRAALGRRDSSLADFQRFLELEPDAPESPRVLRWSAELRDATAPHYSPAAAFFLGLAPGGGHFYTKRPVVGTVLLLTAGGALGAGLAYQVTHVDCLGVPQDGVCPSDQILDERIEHPLLAPAIGVAAAAALLGAIEAALGARRRNAEPPVIRLSDQAAVRLLPPEARPGRHGVDVAWLRLSF